jgi:hypothetical protein
VTKAAAAKDGAASKSASSAPAAAGTGKKIAGHSGGDGDPMVRFPAQFALFLIADFSLFFWLIRFQAKLIADIKAGKMVAAK